MKTLQNNFTTPEQSKRLLELGVPEDSADMKYPIIPCCNGSTVLATDIVVSRKELGDGEIPCWSVGRLMEIFDMCNIREQSTCCKWCSYRELHKEQTYIDYVLFVFTVNKMQDLLDFSKLEE